MDMLAITMVIIILLFLISLAKNCSVLFRLLKGGSLGGQGKGSSYQQLLLILWNISLMFTGHHPNLGL